MSRLKKHTCVLMFLSLIILLSTVTYTPLLQSITFMLKTSYLPLKNDTINNTTLWHYLTIVYSKVERIGLSGVNTSFYIDKLNYVVYLIKHRDYINAYKLLKTIDEQVSIVLSELPSIEFYRNVIKYATAGILLAIPILSYYLIPRIYVFLWYRARKQWVIKSDANE